MESQGLQAKKLTRTAAIDIDTSDPLINFIINTMQKSHKDRNVVLRIETDLREFVKDQGRAALPFPSMSSYHRMLVHRISSLFNLNHNIDPIGSFVVVSKNGREKIPSFRFRDLEGQKIQKSQSLEQRELAYNKARQRIFQNDKSASFGGFRNENSAVSTVSPASSGYRSFVSEEELQQQQFSQQQYFNPQQQFTPQFNQFSHSQLPQYYPPQNQLYPPNFNQSVPQQYYPNQYQIIYVPVYLPQNNFIRKINYSL